MPIGPQKLADGEIWAICLKRRDQAAHFAPHLHDRNPFLFYDLHERARQPSHSPQSTHKYKPFYISAYLAYSSRHTHTHTHSAITALARCFLVWVTVYVLVFNPLIWTGLETAIEQQYHVGTCTSRANYGDWANWPPALFWVCCEWIRF